MHRELAHLYYKKLIRQIVRVKKNSLLFQISNDARQTLVNDLRVMKDEQPVFVQNFETEQKVGEDRLIDVLAVNKTDLRPRIYRRWVNIARVVIYRDDF